jgi:hypothetical protein
MGKQYGRKEEMGKDKKGAKERKKGLFSPSSLMGDGCA